MTARQRQAFPAVGNLKPHSLGWNDQETWVIRADFTTGDRRCRSANRSALSLSVYTRPNFSPSA